MTSQTWTNEDGLQVPFGQDQARETKSLMGKTANDGPIAYMVVDVNWDDLPNFTADLNNDGTLNGFSDSDAYIPAGSYVTRATFIVETLFATGTSYDIGWYQQYGTTIDIDAIDDALLLNTIDGANDVVKCDGDGAGKLVTVGSNDAYLKIINNSTAFTAGKAKLVIEYIQPSP